MPLGWENALPLELGGGPTDFERIYTALRRAMGRGGVGPEGGLEDLWRQCKASIIADAGVGVESAVLQILPDQATEGLDAWEELTGVEPAATTTERQEATAAALTRKLLADLPSLRASVNALDPSLDLELQGHATARVAQFGKAFGPRTGSPPFGTGGSASVQSAAYPNFSDHFVYLVHATAPPSDLLLFQLGEVLNETLPAWVDWDWYADPLGFYLDGGANDLSLLDVTSFD